MQSQENVNQQLGDDILRIEAGNYSVDLGGGFDFFIPFFKFSIETKRVRNENVLIQDDNDFTNPIEGLKTRYTLFHLFEG